MNRNVVGYDSNLPPNKEESKSKRTKESHHKEDKLFALLSKWTNQGGLALPSLICALPLT